MGHHQDKPGEQEQADYEHEELLPVEETEQSKADGVLIEVRTAIDGVT